MSKQDISQNTQNEVKEKNWQNNMIYMFFAILIFGIFIGITVLTSTYTLYDAFGRICAAFIGAMCTAFITLLLLKRQTENQQEFQKTLINQQAESNLLKEIESSIYKEKMQIYKDFLNTLCNVVKNNYKKTAKQRRIDSNEISTCFNQYTY